MVQQCVKKIWESRDAARWAALERALIDVLSAKKSDVNDPARFVGPVDRRVQERRKNVIDLKEYLDSHRRRKKPPSP